MTQRLVIDTTAVDNALREEAASLRRYLARLSDPSEFTLGSPELHKLHQQTLLQVESAQAKLSRGTYGICEECGCLIDPARLRVLPDATLCIKCKRVLG